MDSRSMKAFVASTPAFQFYVRVRESVEWWRRKYGAPSPNHVKREVLLRNGFDGATWVETGTYLGDTTHFLASTFSFVHTIEPEPRLFSEATKRFESRNNVNVINGESEKVLPELLPTLSGDVCFWLDGHFSAGITFKGEKSTPILDELSVVADNMSRFRNVAVLVDDVRCFRPDLSEYADYPDLKSLTDWAEKNDLRWHIEHDIFVASRSGQ